MVDLIWANRVELFLWRQSNQVCGALGVIGEHNEWRLGAPSSEGLAQVIRILHLWLSRVCIESQRLLSGIRDEVELQGLLLCLLGGANGGGLGGLLRAAFAGRMIGPPGIVLRILLAFDLLLRGILLGLLLLGLLCI